MAGMYNFDWPQALQTQLQLPPFNYTLEQINMIYTVTVVPVVLVCMKLGMIFDQMHHSITFLAVPMLMFIGQLGCAIATIFQQRFVYYLILFFRVFCGIATESYLIVISVFLSKIYGQEAGLLTGFAIAFIYAADPLNSLITPLLFDLYHKIYIPLFVGFGIVCISLISGLYIIRILNQIQKIQQQQNQTPNLTPLLANPQIQNTGVRNQSYEYHPSVLQQIKSFKLTYWLLMILLYFLISSIATFISLGNDYLVKRFNIQYVTSGRLLMLPYLGSALSSFIWNWYIIKFPSQRRNLYILIAGLCLITHLIFYFVPNTEGSQTLGRNYFLIILSLFLLSIAFGGFIMIVASSINLIVFNQQVGAAYGIAIVTTNLPFVYMTELSAYIAQKSSQISVGYHNISYLYLAVSVIALIVSIAIRLNKHPYSLKLDGIQIELIKQ